MSSLLRVLLLAALCCS